MLARMLDRDAQQVRAGLQRLLNSPPDLDRELERFGAELLDIAARDPDAFRIALAPQPANALLAPTQIEAVSDLASRTLGARLATPR